MTAASGPVTEFLVAPGRDLEAMSKLGLGGSALVGGRLYAGAMAIDLTTITRLPEADTIPNETRVCMESIRSTLERVGATMSDIAKMTCYASDKAYIPEMWETLDEIFAPGPYPKRITLVAGLGGDCRLEFEIVAVVPGEDAQ